MKLSVHKNYDGILDFVALIPENDKDKTQLNKISHASNVKINVLDTSVPELQYTVEIDVRIVHKY